MQPYNPRIARIGCGLVSLILAATVHLAVAQDRPQDAQIRLAQQAWEMAAQEGWIKGIRHGEIYSEFTVPQTCGPAAILYATLYGMEKEAGLIPAGSKPDPLER